MYKKVFHERIKAVRIELGFTQEYVASETDINQSTLSKYENGDLEPSLENLGILAQFYNVSVDWLLGVVPIKYKEWKIN